MCLLLERRLSLHDFVCDGVLFSLKTEFFRYCEKNLHFGEKLVFFFFVVFFFFFEILVFLRIFWSGVVGNIDHFVAEHVANMLS